MLTTLMASLMPILAATSTAQYDSQNAIKSFISTDSATQNQPYKIIAGAELNYCVAWLNKLNSIATMLTPDSELSFGKNDSALKLPDWQDVGLEKNAVPVRRIYAERLNLEHKSPSDALEFYSKQIDAQISIDRANPDTKLQHSTFDFDNDGYPDSVYRYYTASRHPENDFPRSASGWQLWVEPGNPKSKAHQLPSDFNLITTVDPVDNIGAPRYWVVFRYNDISYAGYMSGLTLYGFSIKFSRGKSALIGDPSCYIKKVI